MKKYVLKIFCLLTFILISQFSFSNNLKNNRGDVRKMKKLFLCSYFAGVKDTFKDFMNNDTKGKKVLFIPTANIDEETKFLVDEAKEVFENLGMEVPDAIKRIFEKKIFRQSYDEYQFATALFHFIPYLGKTLSENKIVLFNHLFLRGANDENGLPQNCQQLFNFKHLLIDEFQDISPQIVNWIKAIHRKLVSNGFAPSIMAIGDDWQSIYGWRGSAPELFINFHKYFPVHNDLGGKPAYYQMMHNYRSLEPILRDAEKILRPVKNKIDKKAIAVKENDTGCIGVQLITGIDFKMDKDIQSIADQIIAEKNWVSNLPNKDKNQVMILSRTRDVRDRVVDELKWRGSLAGIKQYTFHQSKGLQAEVAILCGDTRYDLNHRFRNAVYEVSGIFNQTYDEAATDEIYRLAYVAATRGIRRVIWFVDDSQSSGASFQLKSHH